jgi:hypothetical protein
MQRLDLGSEKIAAWCSKLPDDLQVVIRDDGPELPDSAFEALVQDLATAGSRRIPEVLATHGELVARCGRARRVRMLAWAVNRAWPDSADIVKEITDAEAGEGGGEDGGRSKIAPFFRADMEALDTIAMSRVVRAMAGAGNVDAVAAGIREFEMSIDMQRGGMI